MQNLIEALSPHLTHRVISSGTTLLYQSEIPRHAIIVRKGFIRAYTVTTSGDERIIASNINEVAKNLQLSKKLDLISDSFLLIAHSGNSAWQLLKSFIGLTLAPDSSARSVCSFKGTLLTSTWAQLDGEPINIQKLTITRHSKAIKTI